jgi:hypothetical protein
MGSTALGEALDPERLRTLLARAVMAVFGVPVAHEDDALRVAVEMRDALPELGIEGRIGVMTGEVVTRTEERLATGRCPERGGAAAAGGAVGRVLLGQPTLALVEVEVSRSGHSC